MFESKPKKESILKSLEDEIIPGLKQSQDELVKAKGNMAGIEEAKKRFTKELVEADNAISTLTNEIQNKMCKGEDTADSLAELDVLKSKKMTRETFEGTFAAAEDDAKKAVVRAREGEAARLANLLERPDSVKTRTQAKIGRLYAEIMETITAYEDAMEAFGTKYNVNCPYDQREFLAAALYELSLDALFKMDRLNTDFLPGALNRAKAWRRRPTAPPVDVKAKRRQEVKSIFVGELEKGCIRTGGHPVKVSGRQEVLNRAVETLGEGWATEYPDVLEVIDRIVPEGTKTYEESKVHYGGGLDLSGPETKIEYLECNKYQPSEKKEPDKKSS